MSATASCRLEELDPDEVEDAFNSVSRYDGNIPTSENGEAPDESGSDTVTTTAAVSEEATTTTTVVSPVAKGNIYDSDGKLLMSSYHNETGTEVRSSSSDQNYRIAFGNILSRSSGGFDSTFESILRKDNPTAVNGDAEIGQSIQLTMDADAQNAVYQYMQSNNIVGSVVVMRNDGSIMAEVSYPSYDPDLLLSDPNYINTLPSGACINKAFQNVSPGSCFKIMSEVLCDKHGITSLYDDGTWNDNGSVIVNWDHNTGYYPVPDRSLYSAFVNSSNIFFAKAFQQIGTEDVLNDLGNIFNFGSGYEIWCDFGSLENNIEIYCDDDLRRSAFGQSYVRTCPIYLAALAREAVFGDMVKPFVIKNIVDTNDFSNVLEEGSEPFEVIGSIPKEYRQNLLEGMSGVASNLGVYVPEGYQLYAKTGTAETGAGDFLYITGCVKNINDDGSSYGENSDYSDYKSSGGSYSIVMQVQNPQYHGFSFASNSASYYKGIVDIVLSY
ncbi:MAG: peptidoglycan glycosyltransferase [Ruminococcus sp.]|nr:peptidoglycan glycosyltransferase [Ruminococcus sp.]